MFAMIRRILLLGAVLLTGFSQAQSSDPDQLMRQAVDAQQRGDVQTAIQDYRSVLRIRPDAVEAKVNLGAALAQAGQFDEAIAMYKSALPSLRKKNEVRMNLGLAYYKKGDFQNANKELAVVHSSRPNDLRVAIVLADTNVKLQRFGAAVELLEPLEKNNSANVDLEYVLGAAMIGAGRRREGVGRMEKVADSTDRADAHLLAGATLLQMSEYERARRDLEAALRENPNLPGIYTIVGTARDKTNDAAAAEAAFRQALRINPQDFDANVYLGGLLVKRRALEEAKPYLDRALGLDPTSILARYEMALWESTSGNYQAAVTQLEALVRANPDWLDAHVELASLYYRLHRPADGLRERQIVERITAQQQAAREPK